MSKSILACNRRTNIIFLQILLRQVTCYEHYISTKADVTCQILTCHLCNVDDSHQQKPQSFPKQTQFNSQSAAIYMQGLPPQVQYHLSDSWFIDDQDIYCQKCIPVLLKMELPSTNNSHHNIPYFETSCFHT